MIPQIKFFLIIQNKKEYFGSDGICGDFKLSVEEREPHRLWLGLACRSEQPVDIHFGVELPWQRTEWSYTLIPAIYYNGNDSEPTNNIPALTAERNFRFEAPADACSIPVAMHYDGSETLCVLQVPPFTKAGVSGFAVERDHLEFLVPAVETHRYTHVGFLNRSRRGFVMQRGDNFSFTISLNSQPANSVIDIFYRLNEQYRSVDGYSEKSAARVPKKKAVRLIANRLLKAHKRINQDGRTYFMNVSELENKTVGQSNDNADDQFPAEWFQIAGWCGGSMTAFPLLKLGGKFRQAALENLDFMVDTGLAEHGLIHSIYDGTQWRWEDNRQGICANSWKHVRPQADFIHYLLKAWQHERSTGVEHPSWSDAARRCLDTFCDFWERNGQFGYRIDKSVNPPIMFDSGSCAGAFVLQALVEGMRAFPQNDRYRQTYLAACEYYHKIFVLNGHATGGPLDIRKADDSESAAALADAFTQGYCLLHDDNLLQKAQDATQIFASWVVSYVAPFPPASTLFGSNPCGGVIANVQNRHIGPGICTNSGRFLNQLFAATGNAFYKNLYTDIVNAALNYVVTRDGEFMGYDRGSGAWTPMKQGVVSEQINLSDALNESGETWNVACSWPSTAILLMATDKNE